MNFDDNPTSNVPPSNGQESPQIGLVLDPRRFIWLRGLTILIISVCVGIPAVVLAWFIVPISYTASADLRFLSSQPFVLSQTNLSVPFTTFLNTQISLLTGSTVLSRVLDSEEVKNIPSIAAARDPLVYLSGKVSARVQRGSEIVTVTCSMPEREETRLILQEIISVYMNVVMGELSVEESERLAALTRERDARQMELDSQLRKIGLLRDNLGIPVIGEVPLTTGEAELYNERLAQAEEDRAKAEEQVVEAQSQIALIDGFLQETMLNSPIYEFGVEDRVSTDARVSSLRQEVVRIQATLVSMTDLQQDNSPQRRVDQKRLENLRQNLMDVEAEVRREVLTSMRTQQSYLLTVLEKGVEEAKQRYDKFQTLSDEHKARLKSTADQYAELEDLRNKAAETSRLLENVRNEIMRINVESNAPSRIRVVAPVTVPSGGPDYRTRLMLMAMALMASIGLGFGVGLIQELLDQQVRSTQDLSRLTKLPIIASIPHASEDKVPDLSHMALLTEQAPLSTLADEYRRILARLLYPQTGKKDVKSLVVVSPMRGDGKTSVTGNLGMALAKAGRRVLLVDLCYRRPTLEKAFDLAEGIGISEVLNGDSSVDAAIRETRVPGLYLLGPGRQTDNLAGKLAARDMQKFLDYANETFDQIIIDSQPWLIMADAKLLTPLVDGVLVVVGSNVSTLGMVRRCIRELEQIKANVVGVILNGVRHTPGGYMSKNQKLFYGYVHDENKKAGESTPAMAGAAAAISGRSDTEI